MSRVLSTEQAKSAINNIQNIINGGLTEQINNLNREGSTLSQHDVWDGPLAAQFRDVTWPETSAALDKARTELEELQQQLQKIAQDIFTAGGGA
ncbi:pyrophosphorylase [Rothia nasimurium]|uniref:pyrophosphorylase n=1 Tax=Rothia nasimurium TaxID=85336 RepID=UPI001F2998D7|nr:pyrophosphorylase [Rothia nasimurium]